MPCMYACISTYIHIHKTFFYAIRKFYFLIEIKRETIIARTGVYHYAPCVAIAACNKQLPARLAISQSDRISSCACIKQ